MEHGGQSGLETKKPGRKPLNGAKDRRIKELERDKSKLERKLLIAEKLIELPSTIERDAAYATGPRRSEGQFKALKHQPNLPTRFP